jgi:HSP20 family protein
MTQVGDAEMTKTSKQKVAKITPSTTAPVSEEKPLSPFSEMERYFTELEKNMFGGHFLRPLLWPLGESGLFPLAGRTPKVDVIDHDKDITVKAELPGVEKKDVSIDITDHTLIINAKTSKEEKEERENYYRREISRGSFSRSVMLPESVEIDKATASFKDGILEIMLPKTEPAKRRTIEVS